MKTIKDMLPFEIEDLVRRWTLAFIIVLIASAMGSYLKANSIPTICNSYQSCNIIFNNQSTWNFTGALAILGIVFLVVFYILIGSGPRRGL